MFRLLILHSAKPYLHQNMARRGPHRKSSQNFERNQYFTDGEELFFVPDCSRDKTVWLVHKVHSFFPAYTFPEDSRIIGRGVYCAHDSLFYINIS